MSPPLPLPRPQAPPRSIDWREIYSRLDRAAIAVRDALNPPAQHAQAILDERARALARVPTEPPRASEVLEVATFCLAEERYAIETRFVTKVMRLTDLTPIPGTPAFLAGVMNLRGEILAVLDLRPVLGLAPSAAGDPSWIVVLGDERDELALCIDAVLEVTTLRVDEVLEPTGSVASNNRPYHRGVTSDALIVLDGEALLRDDRLIVNLCEDVGA
jgi:purine-binding chemotaxis protein CheW